MSEYAEINDLIRASEARIQEKITELFNRLYELESAIAEEQTHAEYRANKLSDDLDQVRRDLDSERNDRQSEDSSLERKVDDARREAERNSRQGW